MGLVILSMYDVMGVGIFHKWDWVFVRMSVLGLNILRLSYV